MKLALSLVLLIASNSFAADFSTSVEGTWKFKRLLDTSEVSISLDKANKFIGKNLVLRKPFFQFDGDSCRSDLQAHPISRDMIREDYKITDLRRLKLPKDVMEVNADCFSLLIRDPNHAILNYGGLLLEIVRVDH